MQVYKLIHTACLLLIATPLLACRMLGVMALPGESLSATYASGNWHPYLMAELEAFRLQGGSGGWPYNNRDGWAMTSYRLDEGQVQAETIRSEMEAFLDDEYYPHAATLLAQPQIPILIGHLRQTSSGATDIENPHPFIFTTTSGVNYSFAHNGDVGKEELRALIGDEWLAQHPPQTFGHGPWDGSGWQAVVDSELFFFWIIQNIEMAGSVLDGIQAALIVLEDQQPFQIKNFLFSDGTDLYGYRRSSLPDIHYFDTMDNSNVPVHLTDSNHRVIMSTPPTSGAITNLPWVELADHSLLVFKGDGSTEIYDEFLTLDLGDPVKHPEHLELSLAFPNPFNNQTTIPFTATHNGVYTLEVINSRGQRVFSITKDLSRGTHHGFQWNGCNDSGQDLTSGSYFFRIQSASKLLTGGKLLLLK